MHILVVGSGGREHALCWRFHNEGHRVTALPGSAGMAGVAECVPGSVADLDHIVQVATNRAVQLVVVGPEAPLVLGLADKLRASGMDVFGPGATGAQLEGSKAFCKEFFARHDVRSAHFYACRDMSEVASALESLGDKVVVKADGLAAGKGVVVCDTAACAKAAAQEMFDGRFGDAGSQIIVEQRLVGRELSVMALCDGARYELLAQAEDHKAIFDGDQGPNTGGMGTVSPAWWVTDDLIETIRRDIFEPTVAGLVKDGIDFRGVLYAGLMVDSDGKPWILEYNVRFGDPEIQSIVSRAKGDLGCALLAAAQGKLPEQTLDWDARAAVCVVLASHGYPTTSRSGDLISGLESASDLADVTIFHAGTKKTEAGFVTAGGRVLNVVAMGNDVESARGAAYKAVGKITFSGMQFRSDIGARKG